MTYWSRCSPPTPLFDKHQTNAYNFWGLDNDVAGSSIATKIARTIKFGTAVTAILGNLLLLIVFSQRKNIKVHDVLISTLACLDLVHAAMNILQMALPDQFFISYPNCKSLDLFRLCPPIRFFAPPDTEHVSLHSKSLCKKIWHVRRGCK